MPSVRVEFFGIPRERAGVTAITVEVATLTLGSVLRGTALQLPDFATHCLDGDRLKPGLIASLNGKAFTSDPQAALTDGDSVLILSADVGG